ncbi:hypothetical protein [Brevibacillus sp. HB2.2]|uniref:hypothetical protein n=1 Tax=Brevibacillus sp. HB2.2 TaxID=2738846 RepID=UPI00156B171E|nr:hypothetical protein [Brevibacillus sp. HB2.2]NRS51756.1 hypothetical protein [Brevibacillus sp. HB2.2]
MNTIFLESTINADRHFQSSRRQVEIREKLKGKRLITSAYVIGELKNNFLRNSIAFYNLVIEEETVFDALTRLSRILRSTRQFDRVIKVFVYLAKKVEFNKEELLERLDMLIEDSMDELFIEDIDEIVNDCGCIRANGQPVKDGNRWFLDLGCKQKPKPNCDIDKYMLSNEMQFQEISNLNELEGSKLKDNLSKMLEGKMVTFGRNCWYIGDAVIGVEAPINADFYTTNLKDYIPICSILDKKIFQED